MKAKFLFTSLALFFGIIQGYAISGSGTSSSPYLIYTAADLVTFRNYVNNGSPSIYGKLMADIDLSSVCSASKGSWTPIGNGNPSTGNGYLYRGQFNGNNHTISGLYINESSSIRGLFGTITNLVYRLTVSGTITVNTSDPSSGRTCIGGIVGINDGGRVASCTNRCVISGSLTNAGGIVGRNKGTIYNCINEGDVSTTFSGYIGGVAGVTYPSTSIEDCMNNGSVTCNTYWARLGGIVGGSDSWDEEIENIQIIRCTNNGNVSGIGCAGIIGDAKGCTVDQCINTGSITSNGAGGIVGHLGETIITNCYNIGNVTSSSGSAGGVAASFIGGTTSYIHHCYNLGQINNENPTYNGGIFGSYNSISNDDTEITISDCYCLSGASNSAGGGTFKDADAFQNGEITYLLQQGQSSQYWGQTLGSDNSPIFSSDKSNKVYSETFIYNNETVFVKYRNENYTTSSFPTESELAEIGVTHGYYMDYFGATRNTSSRSIYNSTLYIYDIEGEGSATAPFLIHGAEDLVTLEKIVNGKKGNYDSSAKLTADIDLSSVCGETIGNWTPIGTGDYPYKGTFDGDGHKISNLYINSTTFNQGLFGDNYGSIKNLTVSGCVRSTGYCVGGVVGLNEGHISNCTNLCSVSGAWTVGGIAGDSQGWDGNAEIEWETTITNCTNKGIINLTQNTNYTNYYGSIAGVIDDICTVSNCIDYTGIPFVGYSWGGEVIGCTHITPSPSIAFTDANVKAICVANWDTNGDGELDEDEAAAVTDLGMVFKNKTTITSFDELQYFTGLTTIGYSAFQGCSGLTSVTIPTSVTSIGGGAFQGCSGLTSITIPESVTSIGNYAFYGCSGLTSITIPDGVTSIGWNAFENCSGLTSINIPESVTNIDARAFENCSGLTSINIPESVTNIGAGAFDGCTSLPVIDNIRYADTYLVEAVDKTKSTYDIKEGTRFIAESAFNGCSDLTSVTIPEGVTSIGRAAFSGCSSLTSINIPESVTNIGAGVFDGCGGLIELNLPDNAALESSNGDYTFRGCSNLVSLKLPNGITRLYPSTFSGCSSLQSLTIPASVTYIEERTFYDCTSLKFLTIDDGTSDLDICFNYYVNSYTGYHAFSRCPLESVYLGRNIKNNYSTDKYGYAPFYNKKTLTSLIIGDNVTSIPTYLFAGCSALTMVTIPGSVTEIADYAFDGCTGLSELHLSEGLVCIGERAFWGCSNLTSVTIPNSVTSIGWQAFSGCSNLTSVTCLAENVPTTDYSVFYDVPQSTATLYVPAGSVDAYKAAAQWKEFGTIAACAPAGIDFADANVKAICVANWDTNGDGELSETEAAAVTDLGEVFKDNTTITSFDELQYFTGLTTMNENAFYGCSELASVTIPNNVTSLENSVFERCSSLTSITIPNSVTSIGSWVFKGCSGLTSVTLGNNVTSLARSAFNNCTGLTSITIPESVTSIGPWGFDNCTGLTRAEFASIESLCGISFDNESANPLYFAHHLYVDGQEVTDLVIPEGVTSVGVNAFYGCTYLTSVTLPTTLTSTGNYSFRNCTGLTAVHISDLEAYCGISFGWYTPLFYAHKLYLNDEEVTGELVIPDGITSVSNVAFEGCTGITSVVIPEGVTSIGQAAFKGTNITSVSLPESLTSVSNEAFQNCSGLTSVTCLAEEVPSMGNSVFSGVPQNTATLYVPLASLSAYKAANQWKSFGGVKGINLSGKCGANVDFVLTNDYTLTISGTGDMFDYEEEVQPWEDYKTQIKNVVIEEGVTSIGAAAFSGCSGFTSVTLPSSLTSTGNESFLNCTGLTAVHISDLDAFCRISFGWYAPLYYAHRLYLNGEEVTGEIVFPDGITSVSNVVFEGCTGITSVVIPEGVTSIGRAAFKSTNITSVSLPESLTSIGIEAFQNCVSLTSVTIPESVTTISERAFSGSSGLTSVAIPGNVTNIGNYSFDACKALTSVVISDGVTSIGNGAFRECNNLASLVIPNSVTSIGNWAFERCIKLTSCIVPENVVTMGNGVFLNCTGLLSVIIPDGVTAIQERTFEGCSQLTSVKLSQNLNSIGWRTFWGCAELESIVIPASVESIGSDAFYGCSGLTSVTCLAEEVPSMGTNVFANVPQNTATLYVPAGSLDAYNAADEWKDFGTITAYSSIPATSVALNKTETTLEVAAQDQLTATVLPEDATDKTVTWTSSDPTIATVDENGLVTAVAAGTATITATTADGTNLTAQCAVTVNTPEPDPGALKMLYAEDISASRGAQLILPVQLDNGEEGITSFQFDVELPEGVTLLGCALSDRKANQGDPSPSQQGDGSYRLVTFSGDNSLFSGTEGTLLYLTLAISADVTPGDYDITLKNIELATPMKAIEQSNTISQLTVLDAIAGDANGDGKVSIFDAVQIVNYILGNNPSPFIFSAADLDGNGKITIFDAVSTVNIILNGASNQVMSTMQNAIEPQ